MSDLVSFPLGIQVFLCFPVFPAAVVQGGQSCVCVQLFEVCSLSMLVLTSPAWVYLHCLCSSAHPGERTLAFMKCFFWADKPHWLWLILHRDKAEAFTSRLPLFSSMGNNQQAIQTCQTRLVKQFAAFPGRNVWV